MNAVKVDDGDLTGDLVLKGDDPIRFDLNLKGLNLKRLRTIHDFANSNEFAGIIDGHFTFNNNARKPCN